MPSSCLKNQNVTHFNEQNANVLPLNPSNSIFVMNDLEPWKTFKINRFEIKVSRNTMHAFKKSNHPR